MSKKSSNIEPTREGTEGSNAVMIKIPVNNITTSLNVSSLKDKNIAGLPVAHKGHSSLQATMNHKRTVLKP